MRHLSITFLFILLNLSTYATTVHRTLSGSVTDTKGETIPGANLIWLHTSTGTGTDANGAFELERAEGNNQLVVSCIGFNTDTLNISSEQEYIDITLSEGVELQEVNVVARKAGTQKSVTV